MNIRIHMIGIILLATACSAEQQSSQGTSGRCKCPDLGRFEILDGEYDLIFQKQLSDPNAPMESFEADGILEDDTLTVNPSPGSEGSLSFKLQLRNRSSSWDREGARGVSTQEPEEEASRSILEWIGHIAAVFETCAFACTCKGVEAESADLTTLENDPIPGFFSEAPGLKFAVIAGPDIFGTGPSETISPQGAYRYFIRGKLKAPPATP